MRQWRGPALLRSPSSQQQRPAWLRRAVNHHALRPAAVADKVGTGARQPAEPTTSPQHPQQQQHNPSPPQQHSPQLPPPPPPPQQQQQQQQQVLRQWEQPQEDLQQWEQMRQQVLAFQQAHGWLPRQAANKLGKLVEGERRLGVWCTQQRRRQEGSKGPPLLAAQVAALEAIPGWRRQEAGTQGPHGPRVPWEQRQLEVAAFYEQHGRFPRTEASTSSPFAEREKELGTWCHRQRQRWKGQKKPPLTPEQVAALEAMDGWFWEEWQQEPWEARYQQVAAIWQQHGRFPRRKATEYKPLEEGEKELGNWCDTQRQRWKGAQKPPLTPQQVAALETLPGWRWDEWAEGWEEQRQQVAAFVQQHGRLPRPQGSKARPLLEGEKELGYWLKNQRTRLRGKVGRAALSIEQLAALDASIPGWRG